MFSTPRHLRALGASAVGYSSFRSGAEDAKEETP